MYIQFNQLQSINFGQLQSSFDAGLTEFLYKFDSFDIYDPSTLTNNQITGFTYGGGTYDIRGSSFTSSSNPTINYIGITDASSNLSISGKLRYNLNNDNLSGYFSNFSYSSTNPTGLSSFSLNGKVNVNSSGEMGSGSVYNTSVVIDGFTISYTGNIKIGANGNFTGGKVSNIYLADNLGHYLTVAGAKFSAAAIDKASDFNSIYALINNPKYYKGNDTIVADDQNNNLAGYAGKDVLYGMAGNDNLNGGKGNDYLDGGTGADVMIGGKGHDTYIVDNSSDYIYEAAGKSGGKDSVYASASYVLGANIEYLTLTGSDNISGTGNNLNNTISGNAGNNTIDGGWGADALYGGAGDDTYVVDIVQQGKSAASFYLSLQDSITESANSGNDTLVLRGNYNHTNATTFYLADNLENLDASQTSSTKLNLIGNAANNSITGNAAANIINGSSGDDTLVGGAGNDNLTGGIGADTFKWNLADKGSISTNTDTITDFSIADNDVLDIRDLLSGENIGNLLNYLDITTNAGNTEIRISSAGNFAGGTYDATAEDARIVLTGVDLFAGTGTTNETDLLQNLVTANKLFID